MLKNRNFAIVFSGQMVSAFGNHLYDIALPWYIYALTNSKACLALAGMAVYIPTIVGMFAGVWVDRWRKLDTMFWSDATRAFITLAMFFVVLLKCNFVILLGCIVLFQLAGAFFRPAASSITPLLVKPEDLPTAIGMNQSGGATMGLIGQITGGTLVSLLGAPLLVLSNCISFVVSAISLRFVSVSEQPHSRNQHAPYMQSLFEGIRLILKSPIVLHIIVQGVVVNFGLAAVEISAIALVRGPLHSTAAILGLIFALNSVGAIVAGVTLKFLSRYARPKILMMCGLIGLGASIMGIGLVSNRYIVMGLAFVVGYCISVVNGSLDLVLFKVVPAEYQSRVFAAFNGLITLSSPLGLAVFGYLLTRLPLLWIFEIIGAMAVLCGLSYLLPIKETSTPTPIYVNATEKGTG